MQWFPFLCVLIIFIGYLRKFDTGFKIYGPKGIAQLLTSILSITSTYIVDPIVIYEFLHPGEKLSGSCFFSLFIRSYCKPLFFYFCKCHLS